MANNGCATMSLVYTLMVGKMTSNHDKLFMAAQALCGRQIDMIHDEAKGYAYRTLDGEWHKVGFNVLNEIAGLGFVNQSML